MSGFFVRKDNEWPRHCDHFATLAMTALIPDFWENLVTGEAGAV